MEVRRTEQIWLKPNNDIGRLCHISKNLYNEANYIVRQEFIKNGNWTRYYQLNKILNGSGSNPSKNYKLLPSCSAQYTLKLLDRNWKSFFRAMKIWKVNPGKFKTKPNLPGYKKKDGEFILGFDNVKCKIKNGVLKFPKKAKLEVKTRLDNETMLREVRIVPKGVGYVCEIVYKKEIESKKLDENKVAGIDLGVRNLMAMVNNIGVQPIVIKGGVAKSINQYFNKKLARLRSIYDRQGIKGGVRMKRLFDKRERKLNDHFHKVSSFVVDWCAENGIGTLVVGHNDDWKQNVNLGRRTNQSFVNIPYYKLINQLKYKSEDVGMEFKAHNESHTSKCSFLDNESVEHHEKYIGKRFRRGLFRSAKGLVINADVQGALNIIKKAIPKAFGRLDVDRIEGVGLHPIRYNLLSNEYAMNIFS